MVKAGLKVGEIFVDCGILYKVLSVDDNGNYVSEMTDGSEPNEEVAEVVPEVLVEKKRSYTRKK